MGADGHGPAGKDVRIPGDVSAGQGICGRKMDCCRNRISLRLSAFSAGLWNVTVWNSHAAVVYAAAAKRQPYAGGLVLCRFLCAFIVIGAGRVWNSGNGSAVDPVGLGSQKTGGGSQKASDGMAFDAGNLYCGKLPAPWPAFGAGGRVYIA